MEKYRIIKTEKDGVITATIVYDEIPEKEKSDTVKPKK